MDNPLNVMLIGASGKLGKEVENIAKDLPTFHITTRVTRSSPRLENIEKADVILDVSEPEVLEKNLPQIIEAKKPLVVGTTGLSQELIESLKNASKHIPVLLSPNFSQGMAIVKNLLKKLPRAKKIKISERHHIEKKDAPSGTAKDLAKIVSTSEDEIEVKREENIYSDHKIEFDLDDEIVEISHRALSRKPFAKGAIKACQYLSKKPAGLYTSFYDHEG